ncbi:MAG: hypothetical protein ACRD3M_14520 [Thermoanaerobaculia bacterium]
MALAAGACASLVDYRPRDWRATGERRWGATVDELDIETQGLVGSSGSRRLAPELTIHNTSLAAAVVTGGRIETGVGVFSSDAATPQQEASRTITPGETRRVTLSFRLDRPVEAVLVDPVTLTVTLRTASGTREVSIPMRKG